jgi:hypothetical protein
MYLRCIMVASILFIFMGQFMLMLRKVFYHRIRSREGGGRMYIFPVTSDMHPKISHVDFCYTSM